MTYHRLNIFIWFLIILFGFFYHFIYNFTMRDQDQNPAPRHQEALGQSEAFLTFQEALSRVAPIDRTVLLIGQRGTGKELAASRLHFLSSRWQGPMITLNCAAITPTLIESELFGYEAGAFTGAQHRRTGRFEAAHGGTLFLDEIGVMPLEVQEKLLRVVEYGIFERVGGTTPVAVDVRIIGATNADLPALAEQGDFKHDLLDRLSFEVLHLPPLKDRQGDVALLASHFAARMAHELGKEDLAQFSSEAMAELEAYSWPGNVRQLKNVVERAVYRSDGPVIDEIEFDPFPAMPEASEAQPAHAPVVRLKPAPRINLNTPLRDQVAALEVSLLTKALQKARHNQRQAADLLGLGYHQFRGLYRKYQDQLKFE